MTRNLSDRTVKAPKSQVTPLPSDWILQEAQARFSELVQCVFSKGPQYLTVGDHNELVILTADEFRRLRGERTGQALIAAFQASPHQDIEIESPSVPWPVRDVNL